ncbi:type II toxin-antitoxin system mRNA interferase toxin, RelE/StbE family [Bordetella petrii]|nr:type II toxin-antitoxin system mRNA interferase toxin, RelE/StbE family [Bordetella petrii]
MRVIWTPEALQDRRDIWDYIAQDSETAAARMDALFSQAASRLADYPQLGRPGVITGTRELIPHENYRLVYETTATAVWILALVHVARLWPPANR